MSDDKYADNALSAGLGGLYAGVAADRRGYPAKFPKKPMTLVEELKFRRENIETAREKAVNDAIKHQAELDDLDRAIAALEPAPTPDTGEDAQTEQASSDSDVGISNSSGQLIPVPGAGEESRDQSDHGLYSFGMGNWQPKADAEPDQSAYTDTDAGLEPGNLTQPEIDAATAELFEQAGERDGLDAEFARPDEYANAYPLMSDELKADMRNAREQPVTNPEADAPEPVTAEAKMFSHGILNEQKPERNKITLFGVEFGGKAKVDA